MMNLMKIYVRFGEMKRMLPVLIMIMIMSSDDEIFAESDEDHNLITKFLLIKKTFINL